MAMEQIESLKSEIRVRGFQWEPGLTSVSELSAEQKSGMLGLQVSAEELSATGDAIAAAERLAAFRAAPAAPAAVDWRNNGGDWTTPIKDQGGCGSCVAFGTAATLESRIEIACRNSSMNPDLSEAHLFYCGCGNCCGSGWNFAPALNFAKTSGVALDSAFPYTPSNQPCKAGLTPYVKITGWSQVLSVADRKSILSAKGPMVAGMAVYDDFFSYRSGVYRYTSGSLAGYHAISVVGYNDDQQCWICKNSWGPGWGESGWFRIGYGECLIDTQFAFYDVDLTCPAPVDKCQEYVPYLKKVLQAARTNRSLCACLRYYVCRRGPVPRCTPAQIAVVRRVLAILRLCPQYRVPFCRALPC